MLLNAKMFVWRETAISSLDRVTWNGKSLKVSMSKHASVQLPREHLPVRVVNQFLK